MENEVTENEVMEFRYDEVVRAYLRGYIGLTEPIEEELGRDNGVLAAAAMGKRDMVLGRDLLSPDDLMLAVYEYFTIEEGDEGPDEAEEDDEEVDDEDGEVEIVDHKTNPNTYQRLLGAFSRAFPRPVKHTVTLESNYNHNTLYAKQLDAVVSSGIEPLTAETGPYIGWSEEEQVYLAKHFDFPGVVGKGATEGDAYEALTTELTKASQ